MAIVKILLPNPVAVSEAQRPRQGPPPPTGILYSENPSMGYAADFPFERNRRPLTGLNESSSVAEWG